MTLKRVWLLSADVVTESNGAPKLVNAQECTELSKACQLLVAFGGIMV